MTTTLGFESMSVERRIRITLASRSTSSLKALAETHPTEAIRNMARLILNERGLDEGTSTN